MFMTVTAMAIRIDSGARFWRWNERGVLICRVDARRQIRGRYGMQDVADVECVHGMRYIVPLTVRLQMLREGGFYAIRFDGKNGRVIRYTVWSLAEEEWRQLQQPGRRFDFGTGTVIHGQT